MRLPRSSWSSKVLVLILSTLICLLLLEAGARLFLPPTPLHPEPLQEFSSGNFEINDLKGPSGPHTVQRKVTDLEGRTYTVNVTYHRNGFKRWGETDTNRTKVLILGDSHTQMRTVSNGEEWYAYLEEAFPRKEFFVYGASGFGTLQEFLVFNETVDAIDPDIVIWQFCPSNDYFDNSYLWNRIRFPLNSGSREAYLIDGEIQYRLPSPLRQLRRASKAVDFILNKYQYAVVMEDAFPPLEKWERKSARKKLRRNPEIKENAYSKTIRLLQKAIDRSGNASFYILKISNVMNFRNHEMSSYNVCEEINVSCIGGVNQYVYRQAREENSTMAVRSMHWNSYGNRLAGRYLVERFRQEW